MNKIVVHHLENSRSQRVLWLLEELGLPYEVKRYERDRQTMLAPPELRAVHPLGKSPVITDGDTTVAESGAIVEYLVAKAAALRPAAGTPAALQFTYWLHFAEGTAMPPLVMKLVFDKIQQAKLPFFVKPISKGIAQKVLSSFVLPNISAQLKFMNETLARQPWFAGDTFSAADVQMSFPLEAAAARGGLDTRYPHLQAWLATVHARPAYQAALKAGGPYDILG